MWTKAAANAQSAADAAILPKIMVVISLSEQREATQPPLPLHDARMTVLLRSTADSETRGHAAVTSRR